MPGLRQLKRRLPLSEQARDRPARIVAWLLVAVIVVCVVILIVALAERGVSLPRSTHPPTTQTRPRVIYKNCTEAHKDGRWNIPADDPAYRPALDKDHDGIACASAPGDEPVGRPGCGEPSQLTLAAPTPFNALHARCVGAPG